MVDGCLDHNTMTKIEMECAQAAETKLTDTPILIFLLNGVYFVRYIISSNMLFRINYLSAAWLAYLDGLCKYECHVTPKKLFWLP